jgi:FAD/FMN-containing dehydrogenase
LSKYGDPGPT